MLEVCCRRSRVGRRVERDRLSAPIILPLQSRARGPVPDLNPLPAGVEDKLCSRASHNRADAVIECVTGVSRRRAAVDRGDVTFRVVGVAMGAVVRHVSGRIVGNTAGGNLVVRRIEAQLWLGPATRCYVLLPAITVAVVDIAVVCDRAGVDRVRG